MKRIVLAVVMAVAFGTPSASAQVAPSTIATAAPAAGPLLAGDRVVWLENDPNSET